MKRLTILKLIVAFGAWATIATSCTNQDVLFANGLIPDSQGMSTVIDSSLTVRTSILYIDSIATSKTSGIMFLGSIWNPTIGKTTSQVVTNYVPKGFNLSEHPNLFGKNAVMDSMLMILVFDNCKGDTSHKMHISVHELKDTILNKKATYYSNFNPEKLYNPTPIVEFDISGGTQNHKQHLPRSFFDRLLFNEKDPKNNPYYSDSLFFKLFNGLYFKVTEVNPPVRGAMYRLNLSTSSMQLYYHNSEPKPDTTHMPFFFYITNTNKEPLTSNLYAVKNDFSLSDPSRGGINIREINDSTIQVPNCYITGISGLGARVVIDTAHLNNLIQKTKDAGFSKIAVQRAAIRWYFNDATPENYNWAPKRFGLYFNYVNGKPVPDYEPLQEAYATSMGQSYISDIGGHINRSNGYYEQVITSTIQRLINKNPDVSNIVQLLPTEGEMISYGYASIGGSISQHAQPTVVIVYTMLR